MPKETVDYLVVGAGPAGVQLGYYLQQAGRDYLVLEAGNAPGTFFRTYPRHRTLISINKVHTGYDDPELRMRMDWNSLLSDDPELLFTKYSKKFLPPAGELLRYLADFVEAHKINIDYDTRVTRIGRNADGDFQVTTAAGREITARHVVIATGVGEKRYVPDIPGFELAEHYDTVSVDPDDFTDQRVLVIGKANSAFETADNLIETTATIHVAGPGSLKMAWRTHFVGHLRAVNNNILDTYQLKLQNAILDGEVRNIERADDGGYLVTFAFVRANEIIKTLRYDRVITCTGFQFDDSIFAPECKPELTINNRFPAQTSAWESTNVPGLHFAGTITQVRDFKRSTSGFIHGFRYGTRALHRVLSQRHENESWPHRTLGTAPAELMAAVIERVNRTSALFQQFGFLADLLVVDEREARYYEEVPVDYIADSEFARSADYYVITLDYGPDHDKHDPWDVNVGRIAQSDAEHADEGHYLHPVVRHYRRGELVATHHITENLENEWDRPMHTGPLEQFLATSLTAAVAHE